MKKWFLGLFVLLLVLASAGWFAWTQLGDPRYRSEMHLAFSPRPIDHLAPWALPGPATDEQLQRTLRDAGKLLKDEKFLLAVVQEPSLESTAFRASFGNDVLGAARALGGLLRTHPMPGSTLLEVSLATPDPDDARRLLDQLAASYILQQQADLNTEITARMAIVTRELERSQEELRRLEVDLARYVTENNLSGLEAPGPPLAWVQQRQFEAELEVNRLQRLGPADDNAQLVEAQAVVQDLGEKAESLHQRNRDHFRTIRAFDNIASAIAQAREMIFVNQAWLADLRQIQNLAAAAGVSCAASPTEARRLGWRWPWD